MTTAKTQWNPDSVSFPPVIDNTIRSSWVRCKRKTEFEFFRKIGTKGMNIHLHAGAAFAKGIEVARRHHYSSIVTTNNAVAFGFEALTKAYGDREPEGDEKKSYARMVDAYWTYFETYPLDQDAIKPFTTATGAPGIEFSFVCPIDGVKNPDNGDPLLYGGRFDMLGQMQDRGEVIIVDEKTTSQLGQSWSNQWLLDGQFIGYTWGCQQNGYQPVGALIRGVGIYANDCRIAQCFVSFTEEQIQSWYEALRYDVKEMINCYLALKKFGPERNLLYGAYDKSSCAAYGGCPYQSLCVAGTKGWKNWLNDYEERIWEPAAPRPAPLGQQLAANVIKP